MIDMREMGIASASMLIVGLMVALMMTGMPLGIVTLIVSILSALFYFGYGGMYLVSTNAFGLLKIPAYRGAPIRINGFHSRAGRCGRRFV